jgi:DNA processing protein
VLREPEDTVPYDTGRKLSPSQRLDWLRLIRSENVGPATFRELINHFGSASAALEALPELARRGGSASRIRICPLEDAEAELHAVQRYGARIVAPFEQGYPPWLARIDAAPPLIVVKGRLELSDLPMVAIVGARNGSALGQKFARQLATELGSEGFVISSGLARGIDTAAHRASLERGTVAVLAGGVDVIYPPENADLHEAIGSDGLLLSERMIGFKPRGQDFPRRNRIISGIAAGVIVIEAAHRSGSLITARFAGEQGREVFAVPGSPLDPRAGGTNRLLQDGATLVTCSDDIVRVLAPIIGREGMDRPGILAEPADEATGPAPGEVEPSDRERVLESLGASPVDIDELIRATGLSVRQVHVVLLELDLAGRLERHGRQLVSLSDL